MKKLIFLSLVFLSMAFAPVLETERLVGTWEYLATSEDDESFSLIFQANGLCSMESKDEKLGGEKFYIEDLDMWGKMTYVTDYSTSPFHLDYILTDLSTNEEFQRMPCIFKFLKNGDLQIAMGDEGPRPTNYDEDNAFILRRKK